MGFFLRAFWHRVGIQDWDQNLGYSEIARQSILTYHQWPLWNPYECGGVSYVGNAQMDLYSPFLIIHLLFGPIVGYKLQFIFSIVIGLFGFYLFIRSYKSTFVGAVVGSISIMLSGAFIIPFAVGMTQFMSFCFFPYIFLFVNKALIHGEGRYAVLSAILLTVIFFLGFHYFVLLLVGLFVYLLIESVSLRSVKPLLLYLCICVLFLLLCSIKLLPAITLMKTYPRFVQDEITSGYSISTLWFSLTSEEQNFVKFSGVGSSTANFWNGRSYGIDENGMFIGYIGVMLLIIGLLTHARTYKKLTLFLFIFGWLAFGYNMIPSLYAVLHAIPVLQFFRVAQRYRYIFLIPVSVFIGLGYSWLTKRLHNSIYVKCIHFVVILVITICLLQINTAIFPVSFLITLADNSVANTAEFSRQCVGQTYLQPKIPISDNRFIPWSTLYPAVINNNGAPDVCITYPVRNKTQCTSDLMYRGEMYLAQEAGTLVSTHWTPNVISAKMQIDADDTFVVNQNYDQGWWVFENNRSISRAQSLQGLVAHPVDHLTEKVVFVYLPISFLFGTVLSVLGVFCCVFVYRRK